MNNIKNKLLGKKIYLRNLKIKDCNSVYLSWLNNKKINQFLETRHHKQSIESIKSYINKINKSEHSFIFAICLKETNIHIGNIKIGPINFNHKYCDLSYFIGEEKYWFNGYASDAIDTILKFSFNKLKIQNILAGSYSKNIGSKKVLEKNGFKLVGEYKNLLIDQSKSKTSLIRFMLSTDDYRKLKKK